MRQEDSVVKIVNIEDKAPTIGKCCMCTRQILNDPDEFWCAETRLIGNKHYCGGCLLELAPIIKEIKESFLKQRVISQQEGGSFYSIDQATGRMVTTDKVIDEEIPEEKEAPTIFRGIQLNLLEEYDS